MSEFDYDRMVKVRVSVLMAMEDRIKELEAELAKEQESNKNNVAIYHEQVIRLRAALEKYGGHLGGCADPFTNGQLKCDCGYAKELEIEQVKLEGKRAEGGQTVPGWIPEA